MEGDDRLILRLRPGITGPASLKYRDEEELIKEKTEELMREDEAFRGKSAEEVALWYNDNVIYPDKVRINLDYYYNHSLVGDIGLIIKTVCG